MKKGEKKEKVVCKVLKVRVSTDMYRVMAHKAIDLDTSPEILAQKTIEAAFTSPSE